MAGPPPIHAIGHLASFPLPGFLDRCRLGGLAQYFIFSRLRPILGILFNHPIDKNKITYYITHRRINSVYFGFLIKNNGTPQKRYMFGPNRGIRLITAAKQSVPMPGGKDNFQAVDR
nr:hypothetical protein [bacterium]